MRNIKFRGKRRDDVWVYGSLVIGTDKETTYIFTEKGEQWCVEPETIGQYTEIIDKNDNEIFEGDICTIWMGEKQDNPYIVEDLRGLYLDMNNTDSYLRITRLEVIGNLIDNHESLS